MPLLTELSNSIKAIYFMVESIVALITASALLLGSPGPAPLALAATGATYGIKGGIPFLLVFFWVCLQQCWEQLLD